MLSREMVELIPANAAANHIARSDRCLPNYLEVLFARSLPRG